MSQISWKSVYNSVDLRSSKVYLLFSAKQSKLDKFIAENHYTEHIQLSKPPITTPVFFIKKKNESLYLV